MHGGKRANSGGGGSGGWGAALIAPSFAPPTLHFRNPPILPSRAQRLNFDAGFATSAPNLHLQTIYRRKCFVTCKLDRLMLILSVFVISLNCFYCNFAFRFFLRHSVLQFSNLPDFVAGGHSHLHFDTHFGSHDSWLQKHRFTTLFGTT